MAVGENAWLLASKNGPQGKLKAVEGFNPPRYGCRLVFVVWLWVLTHRYIEIQKTKVG